MAPGTNLRIFASARRAKAETSASYLARKESSCVSASGCGTAAGACTGLLDFRGGMIWLLVLVPEGPLVIARPFTGGINHGMRCKSRDPALKLSLIHISEPTRLGMISYA